jgi:DUF971 family protein
VEGNVEMAEYAVGVKNIYQKDNHSFVIEWNDGLVGEYQLGMLQKRCPCAQCRDEKTGQAQSRQDKSQKGVRARRIYSVGRYALRVEFTSGCSTGIYSFNMLHQFATETNAAAYTP